MMTLRAMKQPLKEFLLGLVFPASVYGPVAARDGAA
jgi:hypothetical protein